MRLLLRVRFHDVYCGWFDDVEWDRAERADAITVKIHTSDSKLASKANAIFTCHRDLRDIAVSRRDMGWVSGESDWLHGIAVAVEEHEFWSPRSDIDFEYGEITEKPFRSLLRLSRTIHPQQNSFARLLTVRRVRIALNELPEAGETDAVHHSVTLLHRQHRKAGGKSRWRTELPPGIAHKIVARHAAWLAQMGYPLETTLQDSSSAARDS